MSSKKFFHDRVVLLLVSANAFLAVLGCLFILFRMGDIHATGFIVRYQEQISGVGLPNYVPGNRLTFYAYMVFLLVVFWFHMTLAKRVFHIRRQFAFTILGMGTLLIVLAIVSSGALLSL